MVFYFKRNSSISLCDSLILLILLNKMFRFIFYIIAFSFCVNALYSKVPTFEEQIKAGVKKVNEMPVQISKDVKAAILKAEYGKQIVSIDDLKLKNNNRPNGFYYLLINVEITPKYPGWEGILYYNVLVVQSIKKPKEIVVYDVNMSGANIKGKLEDYLNPKGIKFLLNKNGLLPTDHHSKKKH